MSQAAHKPTARTVLTGLNVEAGKHFIAHIKLKFEPEDVKQRKAFEELMPELYDLRNSGYSWDQIASILTEIGFKLQPSSIRSYYTEMLGSRLDMCQKRMNEQIMLMSRINQEVKTPIAETELKAGIKEQKEKAFATSQAMLEKASALGGQPKQVTPSYAKPSQPASKAAVVAQPQDVERGLETEKTESFGLLSTGAQEKKAAKKPAFFDLEDEPAIPKIEPKREGKKAGPATSTAQSKAPPAEKPAAVTTISCGPLQSEVKPLAQRPNNPPHIYEPGLHEHPAIPGLMLSLDQRLYGTSLEITDAMGGVRLETSLEKNLRITWKKPIPITPSATSASFVEMDMSLFKKA